MLLLGRVVPELASFIEKARRSLAQPQLVNGGNSSFASNLVGRRLINTWATLRELTPKIDNVVRRARAANSSKFSRSIKRLGFAVPAPPARPLSGDVRSKTWHRNSINVALRGDLRVRIDRRVGSGEG